MPSLSFSSLAIRSSPQVGLSCDIRRINSRRFFGSRGRPRFRDFHPQNLRNAVRCHLRNVSGLTMTRASRQSKNRESKTMNARVAAVERPRLDLAFLKQCELFAKEQILGNDYSVGREEQSDKREQLHILQELPASSDELRSNYCGAQGMRGCILRHARSIRANESGSNFATGWAIGWAVCRATACKL